MIELRQCLQDIGLIPRLQTYNMEHKTTLFLGNDEYGAHGWHLSHVGRRIYKTQQGTWMNAQITTDIDCIMTAELMKYTSFLVMGDRQVIEKDEPVSEIRVCVADKTPAGKCVPCDPYTPFLTCRKCIVIDMFNASEDEKGIPDNVMNDLLSLIKEYCKKKEEALGNCVYIPPKNYPDINVKAAAM